MRPRPRLARCLAPGAVLLTTLVVVPLVTLATPTRACTYALDVVPISGQLGFRLAYNSRDGESARVGRSWTHPYRPHLRFDDVVTLAFIDAAGGWQFYRKEGRTTYVPFPRQTGRDVIVTLADGTYERRWPDGRRWRFDAAGRLTEQRDRNGHAVTLTYANDGTLLTRVTDPAGRFLDFTYDGSGRLTQVADSVGRTVTLADEAGTNHLLTLTDALGGVWAFTCDAAGNRVARTDAGGTTSYTWDALERLVEAVVPGVGGPATVRVAYDALGRRVRRTVVADDGGVVTTTETAYVYDEADIVWVAETVTVGVGRRWRRRGGWCTGRGWTSRCGWRHGGSSVRLPRRRAGVDHGGCRTRRGRWWRRARTRASGGSRGLAEWPGTCTRTRGGRWSPSWGSTITGRDTTIRRPAGSSAGTPSGSRVGTSIRTSMFPTPR